MRAFGDIPAPRADAIHRALLSGLLNNVAARKESHEYTGTRGAKLSIFPGSALFKKQPRWITAAEVVQTSRLYARTVAAVEPRWIEHAAAHLVRRTYSEPTWDPRTAHVYANEKVTLHGLVLVAARRVEYGRIDPRTARELFVLHALVRGEYRTGADFFAHNQRLLDSARYLQAKARRTDLLTEEQQRFAAFNRRIPAHIHNGPLFETWRREAEQKNPRLLFLDEPDVFAPDVIKPSAADVPDEIVFGQALFGLEYLHETGNPQDGVTVIVPIDSLDQIVAARLEWLVPGMLEARIAGLIRSLPRDLRKLLIPAADTAHDATVALAFGDGPLLPALASFLGKRCGVPIGADAFDVNLLEPWQTFNVRVVDAGGRTLAAGRDLRQLKQDLGLELNRVWRESASAIQSPFNRQRVTEWDFGQLPERVPIHLRGMTIWGYPALAEQESHATLRLFNTSAAAAQAMRGGVRRLFLMQVGSQAQQLLRALPRYPQMLMIFSSIANAEELTDDLLSAIADRALYPLPVPPPRNREQFVALAERAWRAMPGVAQQLSTVVADALIAFQEGSALLAGVWPPAFLSALNDMQRQAADLIYPGFVMKTPPQSLAHLPRYLRGIRTRHRKLQHAGLSRDAALSAQFAPLLREYRQKQSSAASSTSFVTALQSARWLLEELRISLFAQELGTSVPVSVGRVRESLDAVGERG